MKVEREIDVAATADELYEMLMDPARLGQWVTIHERFEDAPDQLEQGSTMTQKLKVAGQRFTVRWEVTQADRPSKVTWTGTGPLRTSARVVYEIDERDGRTHFHYLNEFVIPGGAAGRIAGRAVYAAAGREVERSLERLRKLLEG